MYLSFVGSNFGGGDAPHRPDRTLHPSVGVCEAESMHGLSAPEFLPQVLAAAAAAAAAVTEGRSRMRKGWRCQLAKKTCIKSMKTSDTFLLPRAVVEI